MANILGKLFTNWAGGNTTTVVHQPSLPIKEAEPVDPLAPIANLWKNDPNQKAPVDPLAGPILNSDPSKIAEAAGKMDFVRQLPADLVARAMSGNDPAAFLEVINGVAQRTLSTSAQVGAATVEQGLQRHTDRIKQALPGAVRQATIDSAVPENPLLQHAASAPFLKMVQSQIQAQNPGMPPAEIMRRAESTLLNYVQQVASPDTVGNKSPDSTGSQGMDWDKWVNS